MGPNLAEFAGKSEADFVLALLDPNAAINPNYLAYHIDTRDGRSLTGIVRGETANGLSPQDMAGIDLAKFRGHCHVRHARKRRFTCAHCFFSSFSPSLRPLPSGPHPAPTRTR